MILAKRKRMEQRTDDTSAYLRNRGWLLGCIGLGFCIASKESIRYTALWYFDEKPLLLVALLGVFFIITFGIALACARKRPLRLFENTPILITLAIIQCAGMISHTLAAAGIELPEPIGMFSFFGIESSLLLLAVYGEYLFLVNRSRALTAFIYGVSVAGALQIFVIFLDNELARWIVSFFGAASVVLLLFSRKKVQPLSETPPVLSPNPEEKTYGGLSQTSLQPNKPSSQRSKLKDVAIPDFGWFCAIIFLVSIVLMGAYSQWRSQQDGQTASALIQVCSGLGMLAAAFLIKLAQKYIKNRSLFFLCQTLAFPITLGALYLATVFDGPSVSLSVLLFDAAYVVTLFAIWLAPFVYVNRSTAFVICAGLLSYKMGWAIGVISTTSLPSLGFEWTGSVVVTLAFLALIVLSTVTLVRNYKDTDEALASEPEYGYETACRVVSAKYHLTNRENDVLLLLAKGRTASYMARDLVLSESTVRTHIAHIYKKMDINSQQELLDEIESIHKESLQPVE